MRKTLLVVALLSGMAGAAHAQAPAAKPQSVEETVLQLEREWSRADLAHDATTLNRILADDWTEIDYDGRIVTKAMVLRDIANGSADVQTIDPGPRQIRLYGNVAIVTGRDTEHSNDHGKDTSGTYAWTDVFLLRDGRWQAIASQSTRVP